ncbi:LOW QUALITY PROTEIN: coiled-coil domain-containing protein 158 [Passerculus sandwichensis]
MMHPHHICHLESTVCQLYSQLGEVKRICESKVQDLEKQFYLAHSETAEAQTGSTQNSKLRTHVISQTRNTGRGSPMQSVKDEKEARICAMEAKLSKLELEKVQLVSTCTKRLQALNDAKLEKDDLLQELWAGQRELAGPASLQFAECQCIVQCQEQEAMRPQHTLDVRELQGPGYSSASASGKLQHSVPRSHLLSAVWPHALHLPSSAPQKPTKLDIWKEEPLQDLKRYLQELTSSDSELPSVDLSSHGGRKSLLTTMRNAGCPSCSHPADPESQSVSLLVTSLVSQPMELVSPHQRGYRTRWRACKTWWNHLR